MRRLAKLLRQINRGCQTHLLALDWGRDSTYGRFGHQTAPSTPRVTVPTLSVVSPGGGLRTRNLRLYSWLLSTSPLPDSCTEWREEAQAQKKLKYFSHGPGLNRCALDLQSNALPLSYRDPKR
jgi:hypothetical protein